MKKIAIITLSIWAVFTFSCGTNDISSGGTVKYEVTSSKSGFFITY